MAAQAITQNLLVKNVVVDLSSIRPLINNSSQTGSIPVPEGHYAEESMKATVVPNRNMIMLSIAAAWAINNKDGMVCYAAHAGDHAIYPDCREDFTMAMSTAFRHADWHHVQLYTPFIHKSKAEIVRRGAELNTPLDKTYSCYKGGPIHCGVCGTCVERREAFQLAGVPDFTQYMEGWHEQAKEDNDV
jgi:7-cyano-7-deazaguanine synthase